MDSDVHLSRPALSRLPALDQLDEVLDQVLAFGQTTTSILQGTPVAPRGLPLPDAL